jgi:hypothetical protein
MKKTTLIILTIVASLSVSLSSAQNSPPSNNYSPDYLYDSERKGESFKYDTLKQTRRDSLNLDPNYYAYYDQYGYPPITFNYYYQSRFFNTLFRVFSPRRYHRLIGRPGFVPQHIRTEQFAGSAMARFRPEGISSRRWSERLAGSRPVAISSRKRGGFGRIGSINTQFN